MDITEERWAKMIEEVKRVSENNNSREEETTLFKIVSYQDESNQKWYKWYNFKDGAGTWENSEKSFSDKGECLYSFIIERVNFISS